MMPLGDQAMFNNIDPQGNPTAAITNQLVNYGWEYVFHCHILSHEEMDMMRPVSVAMPPVKSDGLATTITGTGRNRRYVVSFKDNSIAETGYVLQRTTNGTTWTDVGNSPSPLNQPNTAGGTRSITDTSSNVNTIYGYRVAALNKVGYIDPAAAPGTGFPTLTVQSVSTTLYTGPAPTAPTNLSATLQAGPQISLTWTDTATNEAGFVVQRSTNGGPFTQIATPGARNNTGSVTYIDTTATAAATNTTYIYQVAAVNVVGASTYTASGPVLVPAMPAAPTTVTATNGPNAGNNRSVKLTWTDTATNETGFTIQRARNAGFTTGLTTANVVANTTTLTQTGLNQNTQYWYRIRANNGTAVSSAWVNATPLPIRTNP